MNTWQQKESFFQGTKNCRLFYQAWLKKESKANILITHGQGEHSECYSRLVSTFNEAQFNIWAWDLRGHGKSEGRRGYVESFDDYVQDYKLFLNLIVPQLQGPIFLLSHSMGGLIQLKTQILFPELFKNIKAQILSAPLLGLALPVPQWKKSGANYLNQFLPQLTLHNEIPNSALTRDPDVLKEFDRDPLRHNRISSGAYLGMMESMSYVHEHLNQISIPPLVQISSEDPVVSTAAVKEFFEKIHPALKQLKVYSEAKHEIYNDIVRDHVFEDLKNYLRTVL